MVGTLSAYILQIRDEVGHRGGIYGDGSAVQESRREDLR